MLLNRLKVWQKLSLLAVLGALLLAVPVTLLVRDHEHSRARVLHQLDGIGPLQRVLDGVKLVQQHRGLSARTLSGQDAARTPREQKAREVDALFAQLSGIVAARSEDALLARAWQPLPDTWRRLVQKVAGQQLEPPDAFAAHTALIERLLDLLDLLAAHHDMAIVDERITLDLHDLVLDRLPGLTEEMGQLRARGTAILSAHQDTTGNGGAFGGDQLAGGNPAQGFSDADRVEMTRLHDALEAQLEGERRARQRLYELSPALQATLDAPFTQAETLTLVLLTAIRGDFLEATRVEADAPDFFRKASAAIDAQFALISAGFTALEARLRATEAALARNDQLLLGGIAGATLLAGVLTIGIVRTITGPLRQTARVLQTAAAGDLTRRLRPRSRDELGHMGRDLDVFLDALSRSIGEIADAAQQLGRSSQALTEVSRRVNDGAARTTTDAGKLSIAAADMNERVASVATATSQMNTAVHEIARSTAEGARVTGEAVSLAGAATTAMQRLDESSARIGEVVALISHITRQTRLLALNATIEAARAGESGRGFGVVAHEVKELADGTARATQDIADKIGTIQADTAGAFEAIRGIGDSVGRVNTLQTTIAAAIEEQSVVTHDISRNITQAAARTGEIGSGLVEVTQIAAGAAASGRELESAAHALAQMGAQLRDLVQRFRYAP